MSWTHHVGRLTDALAGVDAQEFTRFVGALSDARKRGATVYTAGNGGSLAIASHFAGDALKACSLRAVCLGDNATAVTAFSNDKAYHESIAGPLNVLAKRGDVLVLFSCSGTSPNIIRALDLARSRGILACVMFGPSEGAQANAAVAHANIVIPIDDCGMIEDVMSALCHAVITQLRGESR